MSELRAQRIINASAVNSESRLPTPTLKATVTVCFAISIRIDLCKKRIWILLRIRSFLFFVYSYDRNRHIVPARAVSFCRGEDTFGVFTQALFRGL